MIGKKLGHYRVVAKLGEGGMGQVYSAEDTKLGRRVALKVLPPDMAADPDRLRRFQREARAVAALNHPNIVTIYTVEEAEGVQFLTMELVEGKTLGDAIPKGGLALDALLKVALPLVEAVAFAHQHGIIHRDLKPANVMLTEDGRLKVLDFGLAKLKTAVAATETTYLATQLTEQHAVIGTAAYMSPEQAEGKPVDHRSDLFSLGVVLYQTACGRQPFEGDTAFSVISSIIKDTPPPPSEVNRAIPPALDRIVSRALAKDPAARYQSALELRDELQQVREQTAAGRAVSNFVRKAGRSRWTRRVVGAGAILALVAAAVTFLPWRPEPERPAAPTTFRNTRLTSDPGVEQFPSLMPDGKWVVYAGQQSGNWDIYLLSIPGQNPFNLTKDCQDDDNEPAASRDGERIAFRSSRDGGGIFVMGRGGEAVRRVTPAGVSAAFNPTWSPDGTEIAYTTEDVELKPLNWEGRSELWVINVNTSERRKLEVEDAVQASWSPNGHRIVYVARQWKEEAEGKGMGSRLMEIVSMPARGGDPVALTNDLAADWCPVWSPDGRYVYFVSDRGGSMNLWRIAVDEETGEAQGQSEQITTPAPFLAHPSVSADGLRIAYSAVTQGQRIQKLTLDPAAAEVKGEPAWVTSGSRTWANPDPTAHGEWVVFYSVDQPEGDVYYCRPDGTGLNQLTKGDTNRMPVWSPDGTWVAFSSDRSGKLDVWRIRQDGSGVQRLGDGFVPVWSPDGSRIATSHAAVAAGRTDVFEVGEAGAGVPEQLPLPDETLRPFIAVDWSPDASRLAGQIGFSDRGGNGIVVYSFSSRTYERLTDFGEWPAWLPDSRRIFFVNKGREFWVVDTRTREARKVYSTIWDVLGPPRLTSDGRSVFFSRRETQGDIHLGDAR